MDSATTNQSESSQHIVLGLDVEEDVEAELEDFVRLSHTSQFKDAHELFDECLSSYDAWYPVAVQYADFLLREGDFEQLAAFSEKALTKLQDSKERALLCLMHLIGSCSPEDVMWRGLQSTWPALSLRSPYTSFRDIDASQQKEQ